MYESLSIFIVQDPEDTVYHDLVLLLASTNDHIYKFVPSYQAIDRLACRKDRIRGITYADHNFGIRDTYAYYNSGRRQRIRV